MCLLQLTNLTEVKLLNSRYQRCQMKQNCMVMIINAVIWFQDIAKRNFTVMRSFLAGYCPFQRNRPCHPPKFSSWWVMCSWWNYTRNLNVIICYSDDEDSSDSKYVCLNLMDNHYSQHLQRQCQIIIFLQPALVCICYNYCIQKN